MDNCHPAAEIFNHSIHFYQLDVLFLGSHDGMTVLTYVVFLNPISPQRCNCMALLIIALITACVKWITIVCEYISPGNRHVLYLAYLELATC